MNNDVELELRTCVCDVCGARAEGAMVYLRGTPILFECGACNPAYHVEARTQRVFDAVWRGLLEAVAA